MGALPPKTARIKTDPPLPGLFGFSSAIAGRRGGGGTAVDLPNTEDAEELKRTVAVFCRSNRRRFRSRPNLRHRNCRRCFARAPATPSCTLLREIAGHQASSVWAGRRRCLVIFSSKDASRSDGNEALPERTRDRTLCERRIHERETRKVPGN